jgi:hypothetical protein
MYNPLKHDRYTASELSAASFGLYLLVVDGFAAFVTDSPLFDDANPHRRLFVATCFRVLVELLAGLAALTVAFSMKEVGKNLYFWLLLALYNLLGVGEMLFYTGALDERHFFRLPLLGGEDHSAVIRGATMLIGAAFYIVVTIVGGRLLGRFSRPNVSLAFVPFVVPLVMITLHFLTVSHLRTNLHEYIRFIAYYTGAGLGFLFMPWLAAKEQEPTDNLLVNYAAGWIVAGMIFAVMYALFAQP